MGGCSEESVAPAWCRVGQRAPDGAGHAVNPPPGSGPAAGGCAFGRLRGMPRKQAPSPLGARPRLARVRFLRTPQDRGRASCPTRPRHASGPCRGRSCPARPPLPSHPPASAVGWLLEARAEAVRTNGPHPPKHKTPQQRRADSEAMNPRFCPRFRAVRPRPQEIVGEGEGQAGQDRPRHPCRGRAYRDVLAACPARPAPSPSRSAATRRRKNPR